MSDVTPFHGWCCRSPDGFWLPETCAATRFGSIKRAVRYNNEEQLTEIEAQKRWDHIRESWECKRIYIKEYAG